jgi:hypothetical protein
MTVVVMSAVLCACEMLGEMAGHVVCAPKVMVEACLQEAYQASNVGLGPYCLALNNWSRYHGWAYGGGPAMGSRPSAEELEKQAKEGKTIKEE